MVDHVVYWDFDGTLAQRPGRWTGCLLEILDAVAPGHQVTAPQLRPQLVSGFPWHDHTRAHPELDTPDRWWQALRPTLVAAYLGAGVDAAVASLAAQLVRERYTDATRWSVYPDAHPALERLSAAGWRHVLLSNHVPELPGLVDRLGLGPHFTAILTSASIGFEKPHPAMFRLARAVMGNPRTAWMVGDNARADVAGARAVGLPAILVRDPGTGGLDLAAATDIVLSCPAQRAPGQHQPSGRRPHATGRPRRGEATAPARDGVPPPDGAGDREARDGAYGPGRG